MKKLLLKISAGIAVLAFFFYMADNLYSHSTGMVGYTYRTTGEGCSCHGSPNSGVTVSFLGIDSIGAGQTKTAQIKIQGGSAVAGGFDAAVLNGVLNVGSNPGIRKESDELTHISPKLFSGGSVIWNFNYTAPNTPGGWDTLYACGNSVNLNGNETGDTWNFKVRFPVKIITSTSISNISQSAGSYALSQNFPNPFNPTTNIKFAIPKEGFVTLKIYDMLGKEVAAYVNQNLKSGEYKVEVNGENLTSGVYVYKLVANDFTETKRMSLVK
jgi:hypothetical protein